MTLWRLLWRLLFRERALLPVPICDCTAGPCARPGESLMMGADLPAGVWSACPHGQLRHPMLTTALHLDELAQVSPLCQWPDGYSAGVVECVLALRREREIERERSRPQ